MNELSAFVLHIISIYILPITYSIWSNIKSRTSKKKKYNHRWPDTILNDNNNFLLAHTLVSFSILCCLYQYFIYFYFSNIETFAAHLLVSSVFFIYLANVHHIIIIIILYECNGYFYIYYHGKCIHESNH